jgi:hypothetical protein
MKTIEVLWPKQKNDELLSDNVSIKDVVAKSIYEKLHQIEYWIKNKPIEHKNNWTPELESTLQDHLKMKKDIEKLITELGLPL